MTNDISGLIGRVESSRARRINSPLMALGHKVFQGIAPSGLRFNGRPTPSLHARRVPTGEEVFESVVQIPNGVSLAIKRYGRHPINRSPQFLELIGLREVAKRPSSAGLKLPVEVATLLKGQVIDQPAHANYLPKSGFLFWRGGQLEAEAAENHRADDSTNLEQKEKE